MGNFSRDTFDKLKHYVGVRLQQGVPIVDADWNELEDIRRFELEAFLRWFVGNGVPYGNDGFRIVPRSDNNDFAIKGGEDEHAGRILVDGWDVLNEETMRYTEQKLYAPAPSLMPPRDDEEALQKWEDEKAQREKARAIASEWGVETLPPLTTPSGAQNELQRRDLVYLDVWEREITSQEDPDLVHDRIGIETCVRRKREWVVRVLEGSTDLPEPNRDEKGNRHALLILAEVTRRPGDPRIRLREITDLRLTGLRMLSYQDVDQIVADAFGRNYTLDHDGRSNLNVSLREAINATMRGGYPTTPAKRIWPETPQTSSSSPTDTIADLHTLRDENGDIWLFWQQSKEGTSDIRYKKYLSASQQWAHVSRLNIRVPSILRFVPVLDASGKIYVFWQSEDAGQRSIFVKRLHIDSGYLENEIEIEFENPPAVGEFQAVARGDEVLIIWAQIVDAAGPGLPFSEIRCKRFAADTPNSNTRETTLARNTTYSLLNEVKDLNVIANHSGSTVLVWEYDAVIYHLSFKELRQYVRIPLKQPDSSVDERQEAPVVSSNIGNTEIRVFWSSKREGLAELWSAQLDTSWMLKQTELATPLWAVNPHAFFDAAFRPNSFYDDDLTCWLLFPRSDGSLWYKCDFPESGWGRSIKLIEQLDDATAFDAIDNGNNEIWVFFVNYVRNKKRIFCKKILKEI